MVTSFTNPLEAQKFRQDMIAKGYTPATVDQFVKTKTSNQRMASEIDSGLIALTDLPQEQRRPIAMEMGNMGINPALRLDQEKAIDELRTVETNLNKLSEVYAKLPRVGIISGGSSAALSKITGGAYSPEYQEYDSLRQSVIGPLARTISAEVGVLTDQDVKRAEGLIPKATDAPELAKRKLNNLRELLASQTSVRGGQQLSATPQYEDFAVPEVMPGLPASPGEVFKDPVTGKLRIAGTPDDDKLFKIDKKSGVRIDNSLIRFLADSSFLPVAGALAAAPAGIVGGAGGAMAGKAAQQAMKELLDPDAQDLSDHARVIVTEGITDALLAGLTMGVAKVGSKGMKFVLERRAIGNMAKEGLEEVGEVAAKGAVNLDEIPLRPGQNRATKLVRKGLGVTPQQELKYAQKTAGRSFAADVALERFGKLPGSGEEAVALGEEVFNRGMTRLDNALAGKSAETSKVVKILEDMKKPYIRKSGKEALVMPGAKGAIAELDNHIEWIKSFGEEIPLKELNIVKGDLQTAFGKGLEVSGTSNKIVAKASSQVKNYIEKFGLDIKGANQEIIFGHMLKTHGAKNLTKDKAQALVSLGDYIVGSYNLPFLVLKKTLQVFAGDPLRQAKIISEATKLAANTGNRAALRNILLAGQESGIPIELGSGLLREMYEGVAKKAPGAISRYGVPTAAGIRGALPESPEDVVLEGEVQPGFMYR